MILLDTNVISELARIQCNPDVFDWVAARPRDDLGTSSIVEAEVLSGLMTMPDGARRKHILAATERIFANFSVIFPFCSEATRHYARIIAARRNAGRPLGGFDGLIAATALANGASIATRNIADFEGCGVDLIDPWMA